MNATQLSVSGFGGPTAPQRKEYHGTTVAGATSNAIVGFDRILPPTVNISGGTLYATFAEPSEIAASSSVSDAIWEDITSQITAGKTAELVPGVTGLVLVAGASDRTMRATG